MHIFSLNNKYNNNSLVYSGYRLQIHKICLKKYCLAEIVKDNKYAFKSIQMQRLH